MARAIPGSSGSLQGVSQYSKRLRIAAESSARPEGLVKKSSRGLRTPVSHQAQATSHSARPRAHGVTRFPRAATSGTESRRVTGKLRSSKIKLGNGYSL